MILIYPPVAKPSEPPAGIARLSGFLQLAGIDHELIDANLEGMIYLINAPQKKFDTWTNRSFRNRSHNLNSLRDIKTFSSRDRYKRAVMDINRIIEMSGFDYGVSLSLSNYEDNKLSPLKSSDLIRSSQQPENSPFYPYFKERLSGVLKNKQPQFIGFSLNYLSQALCTFAMIGFLRKIDPTLKIILGGGLVTTWINNPNWNNPFTGLVDHCIAGPGELPLLSFVGRDTNKISEHWTPDYGSLITNCYMSPGFILPYSCSSGCFWNKCSFCPEKAEDNPYISVAADRVIDDLNRLSEKTLPSLVHLLDNSVSIQHMKSIALSELRIPWYGFARISRDLTDPDFCNILKNSGCVMLKLGIESGDQKVLDAMNKGMDIQTASSALRELKRAGIATYVYLLFGTPKETLSEAEKTLEFTVSHADYIDFLNLAIFNMPVCSSEAFEYKTTRFYNGDLSLYTDFQHPDGWDRKSVRNFLEGRFKRDKAVSQIIKNDPPLFTSNHAPYSVMMQT